MSKPAEQVTTKAVDRIQERLTRYAMGFEYEGLGHEAIHAAKVRIIDTLGGLIAGFPYEPCRLTRNFAARMPYPAGATVLGTRMKVMPDMAAFVNGTAARFAEANDGYHMPGSLPGHPSDVLTPVLAVAEYVNASGRDLIANAVLAYEVYLRLSDAVDIPGFDYTNFGCVGTSIAAGRLLGLSTAQLANTISMAVVPHNILFQVRLGQLSHWKAVAAGEAGRAGVFAALLARDGLEGPHLPFEGKNGWCNYISKKPFSLDTMGGGATGFRIQDSLIKSRTCCATTISSALAAEQVAPLKDVSDVKKIVVETYQRAKERMGTFEYLWHPDTREMADHSIPYVTAAALLDGTITPRSFDDERLWNPALRALIQKIEVVANDEFTIAYERHPVEHLTRVTVETASGERLVGETGGELGDVSDHMSDAQIEEKFRGLTEAVLGAKRTRDILDRLWHLEKLGDVGVLPAFLVLD